MLINSLMHFIPLTFTVALCVTQYVNLVYQQVEYSNNKQYHFTLEVLFTGHYEK